MPRTRPNPAREDDALVEAHFRAIRAKAARELPVLAVDYHGVLNSYTSGRYWEADAVSDDPPTPGAIAWLLEASERFLVAVTSGRFEAHPSNMTAVRDWLILHGIPADRVTLERPDPGDRRPPIWVSRYKPRAILYLDDRAVQFHGTFPKLDAVERFKPWNR